MSVHPLGQRVPIQTEIEHKILRLSNRLEEATGEYAVALDVAAKAEAEYKLLYYRALLHPEVRELRSQELRDARAHHIAEDAYQKRILSQVSVDALSEECRNLRSVLSACQTLSANVRGLT